MALYGAVLAICVACALAALQPAPTARAPVG
jgi:hypothetical protein